MTRKGRKERKKPGTAARPRETRPDARRWDRARLGRMLVRVPAATAIPWLLSKLGDWPIALIVQKAVAAVAVGLLLFHAENRRTRARLGHTEIGPLKTALRAEFVLGCVVPFCIAVAALISPTSWLLLAVIAAAFVIEHALYEPLQELIHDEIEAAQKRQGTTRYEEREPLRLVGSTREIRQIAEGEHGLGFQRLLAFFTNEGWHPHLSRTRSVILIAMLATAATAAGAAIQQATTPPPRRPHGPARHAQSPTRKRPHHSPKGKLGERQAGKLASPPPRKPTWEEVCPTLPDLGAPSWAGPILDSLYLGEQPLEANPPPGTAGGCTGNATVPESLHGAFVYTIGRDASGEILSVAVDSPLGPAIFLAPAAQRVLGLIEAGVEPLGGYPTMDVASGDVEAVISPRGTFALVRAEKHLPGSASVATPYVVLPPTVTTAWIGAMRERGIWLWPSEPAPANGVSTFRLTPGASGEGRATNVHYFTTDRSARRDQYAYSSPEVNIGQAELEAFTKLAR
jgi:hypothetical protein